MRETSFLYLKRKPRSIFWTYLKRDMAIGVGSFVILSLILFPILNKAAIKNDRSFEENLAYSTQICLDSYISSAQSCIRQLEHLPWTHEVYINHVINKANIASTTKEKIISSLANTLSEHPAVNFICMKFYDSETLYTSKGIYTNASMFRKIYPNDIHFLFFESDSQEPDLVPVSFSGQSYLIYREPFSDIARGRMKGEFNIYINTGMLSKQLSEIWTGQEFSLSITDQNGNEIWNDSQNADTLNKSRTWLMSRTLSYMNVNFNVRYPAALHAKTQNSVWIITILAEIGTALVVVVMAYFLSKKNYHPVGALVQEVTDYAELSGNEFNVLHKAFGKMIRENKTSEISLSSLRPIARTRLLGDLISGNGMIMNSEYQDQLEYCGLDFLYQNFNVIALRLPDTAEDETGNDKDKKAVSQKAAGNAAMNDILLENIIARCREQAAGIQAFLYCDNVNGNYKIIVNYDDADVEKYAAGLSAEYCREIKSGCSAEGEALSEKYFTSIYIGIGDATDQMNMIFRSADHAETAMHYAVSRKISSPVLFQNAQKEISYTYQYSFAEERILARAISTGNEEAAKKILSDIMEANLSHPSMNPYTFRALYSDIRSTIIRTAQGNGLTLSDKYLDDTSRRKLTQEQMLTRLNDMITELSMQAAGAEVEEPQSVESRIIAYVDQNIYDPELSLNAVSDHFGRSSAYISQMFKKEKGVTYIDYVNHARIMRSVELISENHLTSGEVYPMVGYTNLSTFRRNFLKYTRQNPGSLSQQEAGIQ